MKLYLKLVFFLFFLFFLSSYSQQKICQTKKDNLEWINHLKSKAILKDQLYLIKRKIYSDTLFCIDPKRIILDNKRGDNMICKSIIVLEYNKKHFNLDLQERPYLFDLIKKINEKAIIEIDFLDNYMGAVYYGENGSCGVVILKATKKLGRRIEKKYKLF